MKRTAEDRPPLALWERAEAGEEQQMSLGQRMRLSNSLASLPPEMIHQIALKKPTFAGYRAVYHMAGLRPYVNDEVLDKYTLHEEKLEKSIPSKQYITYVEPLENRKIILQIIDTSESKPDEYRRISVKNYKYGEPSSIPISTMTKVKYSRGGFLPYDYEEYYFIIHTASIEPYKIAKKDGKLLRTPIEKWESQMQFMDQMMKKYLP